jgi:hypothetical protein
MGKNSGRTPKTDANKTFGDNSDIELRLDKRENSTIEKNISTRAKRNT